MSRLAAIALGSNLASHWGDREANLREAVSRIAKLGEVRAISSFYDTAPVGYTDQPNFLNGAMLLETNLEPIELMRALLAIELAMGRVRTGVSASPIKGPRIIDLDLLLMGDVVFDNARSPELLDSTELTLPHPAMAERRFVLEPLAEIAPDLIDPRSGLSVAQMLARLQADSKQG